MPKSIAKPIVVKVEIKPGPASESQKQRYKRFWQKVISEVKASLALQRDNGNYK